MPRIKIQNILNKKGRKPIICLTAYSKSVAEIIDKYCDIILVGDSLGMVLYGLKSTREVKFDTMLLHCKAVKSSTKRSLVVCDLPYKTYNNKFSAYKHAKKAIDFAKCDAVKLEGGKKIIKIIKYLTMKGIPVMGHIGLLPQSSSKFKLQGKNIAEQKRIYNDAIALSNSGVFSIVIECVVESLAKKISKNISVPTIGIGASAKCDGQVLVTEDMLGLTNISPKFVKEYFNLRVPIEKAIKEYVSDVKSNKFPSSEHTYQMKPSIVKEKKQ